MLGFLAYMVGTNLMRMGTDWLAKGKLPLALGLWWLLLPLMAFAAWAYPRDGRLRRPGHGRVERGAACWPRSRSSTPLTSDPLSDTTFWCPGPRWGSRNRQ